MIAEPLALSRHLRVHAVPGDAVYLLSDRGATALRGKHVEAVVPLLDGTRDRAALLAAVPSVPAEGVDTLLSGLSAAGLMSGPDPRDERVVDAAELAYWDSAGLVGSEAAARVMAARVEVRSVGLADVPDGSASRLTAALRQAGLRVEDGVGGADLVVVLCRDYADPALADATADLAGTPWLIAKPGGTRIFVGPVLLPNGGPCWHCLAAQIDANRPVDRLLRAVGTDPTRPDVGLRSVVDIGIQFAAAEATKWIAGLRHVAQRQVWTFDTFTLDTARHDVRVLPQCAGCGDPDLVRRRALRSVELPESPVVSRAGGHRPVGPDAVLSRHRHLISPLTGVVTDLRRDGDSPEGVHSFRSGINPAAIGAGGLSVLRSAARGETGGKGATAVDAEVGALCEALERHAGTFHGDEMMVWGRYRDLRERAVHPDSYRLHDPRQVAGRDRWNAAHGPFQHVTAMFDEDAEIPWTPVWSLSTGRHRLMPTGVLYYGAPGPDSVAADSNGCAAGSGLTDAVLQGLLELVERDAVALWWYNRSRQVGVDLAATDSWVRAMRDLHSDMGRELWALDLTSDLGVPVYAALSRRTDSEREHVLLGFGAHLDPALALRRAVSELNQGLSALDRLDGATARAEGDPDLADWLDTATVENQPYLVADPARPPRAPSHYGYTPRSDLACDVADLRNRIEAAGMEVLVLDQTRPDVGLSVVRVIVPGLRPMWARFAPGRLFDVPVSLGRRCAPLAYADLNPVPMFL